MECLGRNLDNHCCWLSGKVCQFLEEDTEDGFRWSCGLRRELGSWDAVLADPRYIENLIPYFEAREKRTGKRTSCKDYPSGIGCGGCGAKP